MKNWENKIKKITSTKTTKMMIRISRAVARPLYSLRFWYIFWSILFIIFFVIFLIILGFIKTAWHYPPYLLTINAWLDDNVFYLFRFDSTKKSSVQSYNDVMNVKNSTCYRYIPIEEEVNQIKKAECEPLKLERKKEAEKFLGLTKRQWVIGGVVVCCVLFGISFF